MVNAFPASQDGVATQGDAQTQTISRDRVVSTDPPYYDNIGYADLSDFFYVWMRKSLQSIYPELFGTLLVPKAEELVATPYRHGSKDKAEAFFLDGMTKAVHAMAERTHVGFPVTIYYAFKQAEGDVDGTSSTGWETFLDAVIVAGFAITGTWPMRTEYVGNLKKNVSALASSIVLVCRPRPSDAPLATRKDFLAALRRELPPALRHLQEGNIAPVDLAQASIGPGMAVFSRYSRILETDGKPMTVRTALQLINQTLDETLAEQEGDFDPETAWAVSWFEQFGFNDGPFGDAETLSKAKNTALNALSDAGIVKAGAGKTRLLRVDELPKDWPACRAGRGAGRDPATDLSAGQAGKRLTVWEMVHHLIRVMNSGGESGAAELAAKLGGAADAARELAYRLYSVCERRKRASEALAYNALVQSWPEITRLAREGGKPKAVEQELGI
jgi:putative DNA methylase